MTPADLKSSRLDLGYKYRGDFARAIGVSIYSINSWETGQRPIPDWLPIMLDCLEKQRRVGK